MPEKQEITPGRQRFAPDWPLLMTPRTLASYLDCAQSSGNLDRTFKEWRDTPGFPRPDAKTGKYYRPAIDKFLARHFGYADSMRTMKAELDKEFAG
ncbi:MAG: hypothetical protein RLN99_01905 [Kiloniellaceae bacterium]